MLEVEHADPLLQLAAGNLLKHAAVNIKSEIAFKSEDEGYRQWGGVEGGETVNTVKTFPVSPVCHLTWHLPTSLISNLLAALLPPLELLYSALRWWPASVALNILGVKYIRLCDGVRCSPIPPHTSHLNKYLSRE